MTLSLAYAMLQCSTVHAGASELCQCPTIGSPLRKVSRGRQFIGINPPRQAAAQAGRIFIGQGDFSGGRSYNGETFNGTRNILIRGRRSKSAIISPGRIFYGWGDILTRHRRRRRQSIWLRLIALGTGTSRMWVSHLSLWCQETCILYRSYMRTL